MPDDVARAVNLDDAVVELISDKDVAMPIKVSVPVSMSGVCHRASAQDHAYSD